MIEERDRNGFEPGDVVKYREPMDEREAAARFTVVEPRGPRVLIRFHCDMAIKPTENVLVTDIEKVRE